MSLDNESKENEVPIPSEPWIIRDVSCPICGRKTRNREIKKQFLEPAAYEPDHHIVRYKFEEKEGFSELRPQNYFILYCGNCSFADSADTFNSSKTNGVFEEFKHTMLIDHHKPDTIPHKLAQFIKINFDSEKRDTETAIALHLLSLFHYCRFSPKVRNFKKITTLYLRIKWLFSEKNNDPSLCATAPPNGYNSFEEWLAEIASDFEECPTDEKSALKYLLEYFEKQYEHDRAEMENRVEVAMLLQWAELLFQNRQYKEVLKNQETAYSIAIKARNAAEGVLKSLKHQSINGGKAIMLRGTSEFMTKVIERSTELRQKTFTAIFENEKGEAAMIASKVPEPNQEKVYLELMSKGFHITTAKKISTAFERKPGGEQPGKKTLWRRMKDSLGGEK